MIGESVSLFAQAYTTEVHHRRNRFVPALFSADPTVVFTSRIVHRAVYIAFCVILKLVTPLHPENNTVRRPDGYYHACLHNPTARPLGQTSPLSPYTSRRNPTPCPHRAMIRSSRRPDSLVFQLQGPTWHADGRRSPPEVLYWSRVRRYFWIRRLILRDIRAAKLSASYNVDSKHVHDIIIPFSNNGVLCLSV
jgi:hypothetical protein